MEFLISKNGSLFVKKTFSYSDIGRALKVVVYLSYVEMPYLSVQEEFTVKIVDQKQQAAIHTKQRFAFYARLQLLRSNPFISNN